MARQPVVLSATNKQGRGFGMVDYLGLTIKRTTGKELMCHRQILVALTIFVRSTRSVTELLGGPDPTDADGNLALCWGSY